MENTLTNTYLLSYHVLLPLWCFLPSLSTYLLSILRKYCVQSTFQMLGKMVKRKCLLLQHFSQGDTLNKEEAQSTQVECAGLGQGTFPCRCASSADTRMSNRSWGGDGVQLAQDGYTEDGVLAEILSAGEICPYPGTESIMMPLRRG
jgi:hypothetical protein